MAPSDLGRLLFYPVFVLGRGALLVWLFLVVGPGFPPVIVGFTAASLALLLLAELWIPARADWTWRGDGQIRNDLGHSLAYLFTTGPVVQVLLVGTAIAWLGSGEARLWAGVWPDAWTFAAQVLLVIVLADGLEYTFHRLTHQVAWLWPLHALHHTPDRLHALKTFRHHWLYALVRGVFVPLPLLVLGAPLGVLIWAPLALATVGSVAHSNLDVRLPAWLHRVLNTPQVHRIHHSVDEEHGRSNYCFVLPLWDLLFGTWRAPEGETVAATGLHDDPVPADFRGQLVFPLRRR